jgi:hypothetical protein
MSEQAKTQCPECDVPQGVGRRDFLMTVGGTAVTLASLQAVGKISAQQAAPAAQSERAVRPAEAMIRELFSGLTAAQRAQVVLPWNHGGENSATPTRKRMYNAPIFSDRNIGTVYTRAQQDLNQRIIRSICSDEEGYRRISRNGTWDASNSFENCGAYIFGDPSGDQPYAWVFTGHHLTVRCDGNSERNAAFGGPMYYGHSPDGFSQRNLFNYQTRSVLSVWNALSEAQRRQATMATYVTPRELEGSIRFRQLVAAPPRGEMAAYQIHPGIAARDLTADQRGLINQVMRDLLSPYRREDADKVMDLVRQNGGMDRIHLGFFRDPQTAADKWDFWRLEGPGFVWNFRILPHVHCYVNIGLQTAPPRA